MKTQQKKHIISGKTSPLFTLLNEEIKKISWVEKKKLFALARLVIYSILFLGALVYCFDFFIRCAFSMITSLLNWMGI